MYATYVYQIFSIKNVCQYAHYNKFCQYNYFCTTCSYVPLFIWGNLCSSIICGDATPETIKQIDEFLCKIKIVYITDTYACMCLEEQGITIECYTVTLTSKQPSIFTRMLSKKGSNLLSWLLLITIIRSVPYRVGSTKLMKANYCSTNY